MLPKKLELENTEYLGTRAGNARPDTSMLGSAWVIGVGQQSRVSQRWKPYCIPLHAPPGVMISDFLRIWFWIYITCRRIIK